ncbi:MAG: hypothetical protein HYU86_09970 [Chloroflexi bacterium]|nr:hypothetical protein [Chloroflexota bacterium]
MVARKKRRSGLSLFQVLLAVGFLSFAWFSFGQNVLAPPEQLRVPERLGTMELIRKVEGSEAMAQITKLHGVNIELETAYIADYAQGQDRVTAWVGRAESKDAALELLKRMSSGIERGGSGFGNLQRLTVAGQEVFQAQGPDGKHFFYNPQKQSPYGSWEPRDEVVWLTIEASDAMPIVEQAVKAF